jgi:cell division protein FtsW
LALFLYLSKLLVRKKEKLNDWKEGILPLMIPIVVICGLIFKDNLSTSLLVFALAIAVLFIGQVPMSKLLTMGGAGALLLVVVIGLHTAIPQANILPRYETWKNRLANKVTTEQNVIENAQALDARRAIHAGSWVGLGVGDGKLKEYLPEAYADFYYASFVEEFGFVSALILTFIYMVLLFRIIRIGLKSDQLFETYVCMAIGLHLLAQASINMLVCTGVFPVTGQNMPFLAMGGSALLMACVSIGIIQAIAVKQNAISTSQTDEE